MPRVERSRFIKLVALLFVVASSSGCSNSISQKLLSDRPAPDLGVPANKLALPPADTLQNATPDQNAAFVEETELPADVPTLTELSSRPLVGIDAPKIAMSLDQDANPTVMWRGKRSLDGVDVANRNGALCSGVSRSVAAPHTIRVACSDGRVGTVKLIPNSRRAQIAFNSGPTEDVDLEN